MKTTFLKILLLVAIMAIYQACEKDEPGTSNQTNGKTTALFNPSITYGTMTDQDGNVYKTVIIGTQTWMAENLRTTKYNDGTSIPNVTDDNAWANLSTDAYCYYLNTNTTDDIATYGCLYNWYAVNTDKLCPTGWHVPTVEDWATLTDYLDGTSIAGGKLKETGFTHWISPNLAATNETGFTALPGGERDNDGTFIGFGINGNYWTATEYDPILVGGAYFQALGFQGGHIVKISSRKESGYSVRCVKD